MSEPKNIVDLVHGLESKDPISAAAGESKVLTPENLVGVPMDDTKDKIVAQLLANVASTNSWYPVKLPSRGSLYSNFDSDSVEVKPITYAIEKQIRHSIKAGNSNVVDLMLESCSRPLPVDVLTVPDKLFLMYKIREFSYGSTYPIVSVCKKCGAENSLNLELSGIKVKYLEDTYEEFCTMELPDSKVTCVIKPLRSADITELAESKDANEGLLEHIVSINDIKDRMIISKFIEKTTIRDVSHVREKLFSQSYGLDTKVNYFCDDCTHKNHMELSFSEHFFSAS
tara:strand:- start:599 stop:1450 length:852 start_codon:yes stop_codon:yes gene_type:complete